MEFVYSNLLSFRVDIDWFLFIQPDRVMPVRLKSLYTEDNGATWKAQHATVTNLGYDYERGLRLPTSGMITKIKWT